MVAPETAIDELVGLEDLVESRNSCETPVPQMNCRANVFRCTSVVVVAL
jgi:hypothetical protein